MTDISNAVMHGRTRRPGTIDAGIGAGSTLLVGLVAYWKLEEASGTRADSVGSNTMSTVGTVSSAAGKQGNALSITAGTVAGLSAAGSITASGSSRGVSIWFKPNSLPGQRGLASAATAAGSTSPLWLLVLCQGGSTGPVAVYHGGNYRSGTTVVSTGNWYHMVYNFNSSGNAVELWVNGTREVNTTAADSNTGTNTYLGASFSDYGGLIDEVGIWNRVLTSTEVAALYNGGNGTTYPNLG